MKADTRTRTQIFILTTKQKPDAKLQDTHQYLVNEVLDNLGKGEGFLCFVPPFGFISAIEDGDEVYQTFITYMEEIKVED